MTTFKDGSTKEGVFKNNVFTEQIKEVDERSEETGGEEEEGALPYVTPPGSSSPMMGERMRRRRGSQSLIRVSKGAKTDRLKRHGTLRKSSEQAEDTFKLPRIIKPKIS